MKKYFHVNYYIFAAAVVLSLAGAMLNGDEKRVVSLNGTYDFDGDGLSEFLTLEKLGPDAIHPTTAGYYEIDEVGNHIALWRASTVQPVVDARIGDMDGDGAPEIVVLTAGTVAGPGRPTASWLYWFPWETDSFSETARAEWAGPEGRTGQRPFSMALVDWNNSGTDKLAVAVGSPRREILLLTIDSSGDVPRFATSRVLSSPVISSGYGHIYVCAIDHNKDGYLDLVVTMRELAVLKVQIFNNEAGDWIEGPSFLHDVGPLAPDFSGLLPSAVNGVDIDQNGVEEVFLPFRTGVVLSIAVQPDGLAASLVPEEVASLFTVPEEGIEDVFINDILLERAESGITGMRARRLKLQAVQAPPTGVVEQEPAVPSEGPPLAPRKVRRLELTTVDKTEQEPSSDTVSAAPPAEERPDTLAEPVDREPPVLEVEVVEQLPPVVPATEEIGPETLHVEIEQPEVPGPPRKVRKLELTTVDKPEVTPTAEEPVEQVTIPPDVEISDTAAVGQQYSHSLEPGEGRRLHAFRPTTLPHGAFFDPPSRAVLWTPSEEQLGVHRLAYQVEFELTGNRATVQEVVGTGVQVTTTTVTDTVEVYILVRSPEEP